MKIFKEIISIVTRTIGAFALGQGIVRMVTEQYQIAAYCLLVVSILFIIGYFAERIDNLHERR